MFLKGFQNNYKINKSINIWIKTLTFTERAIRGTSRRMDTERLSGYAAQMAQAPLPFLLFFVFMEPRDPYSNKSALHFYLSRDEMHKWIKCWDDGSSTRNTPEDS